MLSFVFAVLFSKPGLFIVGGATGFGLGRVKNAKKLAEAQAAVNSAKAAIASEVKKVV